MGKYDDIIYMPRHISKVHKQMSLADRAAQFSSFAALVGYEDKIKETARLTDSKIILSEEESEEINNRINYLIKNKKDNIEVNITHFISDIKKSGGKYIQTTGIILKINEIEKTVYLSTGDIIQMEDIIEISGEVFEKYDF